MDLGTILLHLAVVLVAARIAGEVAERVGVPTVLAEILVGVALGPSALGLVNGDEFIRLLGELGVILLLFEVGRQMDLTELARVGGAALRVAIIGVAVPMAAGYAAMRGVGLGSREALFIAGGITATSVGLTARVFGDLRMLASTEARTVLGAAVADDVIGLIVLTVVVGLSTGSAVSPGSVTRIAGTAIGFVVVATVLGVWLVPRALRFLSRHARTEPALLTVALAFALGIARLADVARLAPIVGAFVAGLAFARSDERDELHRRIAPLGHVLIPIFFLQIGLDTDIGVFAHGRVLGIAGALIGVAIAGKLVAGLGISARRADRLMVGIGMLPRGEVGLIFAGLGLSSGVLGAQSYGALVLVVLATSVVTPPLIRLRLARARAASASNLVETVKPPGGWLTVTAGAVELAVNPPASEAGAIALDAAVACATRRPGNELLTYLSANTPSPAWDEAMRARFVRVLREGNERSWRFLDVSGALHGLLPELARAMRGVQDELSIEPSLRWSVLAGLQRATDEDDIVAKELGDLSRADAVYFAALARSAFANARDPEAATIATAVTIGFSDEHATFAAFLVEERTLLPAAAARFDMGTEESVLSLAAHIGSLEAARALYVLAVAENAMEEWERERLDELHALVSDALAHPDLTGLAAESLVEQRKEAARAHLSHMPDADVRRHLDAAPRRYLLAQDPAAIERHVGMLGMPLGRDEVRLNVQPSDDAQHTMDVVMHDRPGLLAAITGALAAYRVDIEDAFASTWLSGIAIDVFRVRAPQNTDWGSVRREIELRAAGEPELAEPIPGLVTIDNDASPWHTIVEVEARDRVGLLHRVASALASAGMQIAQASVTTRDGMAVDTFWVTGRGGSKLDAAGERALRDAFAGHAGKRWRSPWRRARAAGPRP